MSKRRLLDSFALLAWLNEEPGADRVDGLLKAARRSSRSLLMNVINVGEVYYIRAKDGSPAVAEAFLDRLPTWPIDVVQNTFDDVLAAARLKARFPISYADAFAAATAMRTDAILVTGDPEFHALEALIEVDWLSS